jgi:hypothetical protein
MSFTKQIYEKTSMALPDVTARTFSRYCGKSEGYYGSISSQNLDISTNGLLYLPDGQSKFPHPWPPQSPPGSAFRV